MAFNQQTSKDIVIQFKGKLDSSFQTSIKQAFGQIEQAQKRMSSLASTAKAAFSVTMFRDFKEFLKGTIQDAQKAGSPLQKMLGDNAVKDAQRLADTMFQVKTSVQAATLSILSELTPAIRMAADAGKTLSERLSGGLQGRAKQIADERAGMKSVSTQESLDTRRAQLTALQRERAGVFDRSGAERLADFLPFGIGAGISGLRGAERSNQAGLLDAQINTLALEIGALEKNIAAINAENMRLAFVAMKKSALTFADGLQGALRDIRGGFIGVGKNMLDKGLGHVQGIRDKAWEEQRQRSLGIIESTKTPAERMQEQFRELVRLRDAGGISGEVFGRAKQNLINDAQGMLPQQRRLGETPGLQPALSRTSTRGPEQRQTEQLSHIDKSVKEQTEKLEKALREVLAEIKGEGAQDT